ncbi:MAG: MoxR family ATPase [Acidobacteriota bacterium]|nr:MAG: MoxR family ATPase [Acidobacteriota bacterium]
MTEKSKNTDEKWWIYRCTGEPHDGIRNLPDPPPWRKPVNPGPVDEGGHETGDEESNNPDRGRNYLATDDQKRLVNMALYLRRPLLITGKPGTGKSSLAYSVAWELKLGPVLRWPITSRSTLADGLYRYDAIGRLQETELNKGEPVKIEKYLRLGPLGTALLPSRLPRVLLVDEIDKSDIDLPNDLLNIFEEGEYEIPELARYSENEVKIRVHDSEDTVTIKEGKVQCCAFPFVILTSNGEREFPPPLLRRCLQLEIDPPNEKVLETIIRNHLKDKLTEEALQLIPKFLERRRTKGHLSNDQLLNAVFMVSQATGLIDSIDDLEEKLYRTLGPKDAV